MEEHLPFVSIPFFPPSANHIYVTARNKRFLSKEASTFKNNVIAHIQRTCLDKILYLDKTSVFRVWYIFYFNKNDVLSKTFGSGKKGAAESRYKKIDVQNRLKLIADALSTAIGIDDSQFWEEGVTKKVCAEDKTPYVDIFITSVPLTYFLK